MTLEEKLNNPKKVLEAINREVKYLPNGISYVYLTKDSVYIKDKVHKCHNCLKPIHTGYAVWSVNKILCTNCFQELYKISMLDNNIKKQQENINSYKWYLCFFDNEVREHIKNENLKMLKKHFKNIHVVSL